MLCKECFYYDLKNKGCLERHNMPAEEEKCYFLEPQVEISLNQAEIWEILGMFIYVRDREDPVQNSFYNKIRKTISPNFYCEDEAEAIKDEELFGYLISA